MFRRGFKSWCENVAVQLRKDLELKASGPLDPRLLASHLDVNIFTPKEIPGLESWCLKTLLHEDRYSWSAVTVTIGKRTLIVVNSSHSKARQFSNLMHELAHIIIGHEPGRYDLTENGLLLLATYKKDQEDEAAWLSGCLLLPRQALFRIRRKKLTPRSIATIYCVSLDMLQYRLNVTGVDQQIRSGRRIRTLSS